jgi:hypothetical protein
MRQIECHAPSTTTAQAIDPLAHSRDRMQQGYWLPEDLLGLES